MTLEFKKNEGKKHVISYHRDDGTKEWMHADDFMIMHDLSHFAIEKTLGYKTAFYGMINRGIELTDFLDKTKREAMDLTSEAAYAESMANLFLMEIWQGRFENFNQVQQGTLHTSAPDVQPLNLLNDEIDAIRSCLVRLLHQWQKLQPGESIQLQIIV
jgi:hypothetical protein